MNYGSVMGQSKKIIPLHIVALISTIVIYVTLTEFILLLLQYIYIYNSRLTYLLIYLLYKYMPSEYEQVSTVVL
jgi:hypothetical protein